MLDTWGAKTTLHQVLHARNGLRSLRTSIQEPLKIIPAKALAITIIAATQMESQMASGATQLDPQGGNTVSLCCEQGDKMRSARAGTSFRLSTKMIASRTLSHVRVQSIAKPMKRVSKLAFPVMSS
jgi:hypothetical protein